MLIVSLRSLWRLYAERFCDGALLAFFENGSVLKWLKHLKDVDCLDGDKKLSEVFFEIGDFGGYDTYRLLFANKRSHLISGRFLEEPQLQRRYSIRENEKLIETLNNIHTEYWKSA
jgi:hypothetical protein